MKRIIYILILLLTIQMHGQDSNEKKKFKVELLTVEKTSNDTIISTIIETYSDGKRIKAAMSDFDGISVFFIDSKDVVDDKILLKLHGPKCSILEKEYNLTDDINTKIDLEYGETEYTHYTQLSIMLNKLNIVFEVKRE